MIGRKYTRSSFLGLLSLFLGGLLIAFAPLSASPENLPVKKGGYPQFTSRKKGAGSFRFTGSIHLFEKSIQLPCLGKLRLKEHGDLPVGTKVAQATVPEQAGRWDVSITRHHGKPLSVPPLAWTWE
jgi:hypothetical protein